MILDLYSVVSNFADILAHNLIGYFFRWLFLFLRLLRLYLVFLAFVSALIAICQRIRFAWWWVWQWWFWIRFRWFVRFSFSIWRLRWSCWRLHWSCWQFRKLCSWRGFWCFFFDRNQVNWWRCSVGCVCTNRSWVQMWSTHWNVLTPKVPIFPPILKIGFIDIVYFWPCCTHSNHCRFTKNMIRRRPMGSIYWHSYSGREGTEDVEFIRCVDGREP